MPGSCPVGSEDRTKDARRVPIARGAALLLCCAALVFGAARGSEGRTAAEELEIFKTWLDRQHHGYGCDDGPARFQNATVDAAYAGRRFYYVLTHARGIRPPFQNALSLVADVGEGGEVRPLSPATLDTYRDRLLRVRRPDDARRAAAAVLILALGDPGESRWPVRPDLVAVAKSRKGWLCTYSHAGESHTSRVTFDREGALTGLECNPPPVP